MKRTELEKELNEKIRLFLERIDRLIPKYSRIVDKVVFNKHYNRLEWRWDCYYVGLNAEIKLLIDTFVSSYYGIFSEGYDCEHIVLYWDCEKE